MKENTFKALLAERAEKIEKKLDELLSKKDDDFCLRRSLFRF
jgi:hypothetical protein